MKRYKNSSSNPVIAGLTRNPMNIVKHLLTISRGLRVKPAMTRLLPAMTGVIFILFFFQACDEELISPIPSAPVDITLDLDFADMDLVPALATKSFTKQRVATDRIGFGGVLVVNGSGSNGAVNLYAYDLACPVEADRNVCVVPDDGGKATCPKCGAVYVTMWGSGLPENSKSKYPLRSYVVRPTGGNKFLILN